MDESNKEDIRPNHIVPVGRSLIEYAKRTALEEISRGKNQIIPVDNELLEYAERRAYENLGERYTK